MRSLVFAALVLSASLTMTASAQVKAIRLRRTETLTVVTDSPKKTPAKISVTAASTQVYRVGPGDVLDIQLSNYPSRNSTLYTVLSDVLLEYPLAGNPIVVRGITPLEIATLLPQRIKIFDNPKVKVDVRDYASHAVTIIGFVSVPGTEDSAA